MTWYKKAKLADKSPSETSNIYSACMYCKRWATHEGEEAPDPSHYVWKKENELDSNEKAHAYAAEHEMAYGTKEFSLGISHGICPYCDKILEEIGGWPRNEADIQHITQKSLEM